MAKDYHPKNKPPFFQKVKQKEEEPASPNTSSLSKAPQSDR